MKRLRFLTRVEDLAIQDLRKAGEQREIDGKLKTLAVIPLSIWIEASDGREANARAGLVLEEALGQKISWADQNFDKDIGHLASQVVDE